METLPKITLSRAEMIKRVARFKDLKGFDGGLPDSKMPGCERTLYNVIGFQPPKGKGGAVTSPVGDDAARLAAIKISEGFNLGYCRANPLLRRFQVVEDAHDYFGGEIGIFTATTSLTVETVFVGRFAVMPRQADCDHQLRHCRLDIRGLAESEIA